MTGYDTDEVISGNNVLREQLGFYKKNKIVIHIEKKDGHFYNGDVLEVAGDMLILDDKVLGAMPIHFIEIETLERYKEKA